MEPWAYDAEQVLCVLPVWALRCWDSAVSHQDHLGVPGDGAVGDGW